METKLFPALVLLFVATFIGMRVILTRGGANWLARLKKEEPLVLTALGWGGLVLAVLFASREMSQIGRMARGLGGEWTLAFVCGFIGAFALAGKLTSVQRRVKRRTYVEAECEDPVKVPVDDAQIQAQENYVPVSQRKQSEFAQQLEKMQREAKAKT